MTEIENYLSADRVALDLSLPDDQAVLAQLGTLLGGRDASVQEAVREDLVRREQMGSTGVGGGIAFPHARVAALPGLRLAFLRTARPLEYGAIDGRAVDLFVAIAGPENLRRDYLAVLGTLSYVFRAESVRDELRRVASPAAAVETFRRLAAEARLARDAR